MCVGHVMGPLFEIEMERSHPGIAGRPDSGRVPDAAEYFGLVASWLSSQGFTATDHVRSASAGAVRR
jgi:hypothetical protein